MNRRSLALPLALVTPALEAQGLGVTFGVGAQTSQLLRSQAPDVPLNGLVAHLFAGVSMRRFSLEGAYAQGTLTPEVGNSGDEDLVDGEVMVVFRPLPWLRLRTGPRLRAYLSEAGTERWTRVELGAGVRGPIVPGRVMAQAEYWSALSAEVNTTAGAAGASGGRVSLTLEIPSSPFALQLFYAVDRARLNNARDEVLEGVGLGLTVGRD
jgi:hypothetical protein